MFQSEIIVPEQVFVNLSSPMNAQPFSHVDIPEFRGVNRHNAPGWFLQAMGSSRLFEDVRISIVTAVAWFHQGERGFFRYWPEGRENDSVRHENMWNTAVVGDNDFMHHLVERNGPKGATPPEGMSINTELNHDGVSWKVLEQGEELASYGDVDVRLSLSWKAKVYSDEQTYTDYVNNVGGITIAEAIKRFNLELRENFTNIKEESMRKALTERWSGYVR